MYTWVYFPPAAVDFICDEPRIRAISFVGSDRVGKYIYERGTANGKRVQSNMVRGFFVKYRNGVLCTQGAKNHGIVMPDANKEHAINQVCTCLVLCLRDLVYSWLGLLLVQLDSAAWHCLRLFLSVKRGSGSLR